MELRVTIHPPIATDVEEIEINEVMDKARKMILSDLDEPDLFTKEFK